MRRVKFFSTISALSIAFLGLFTLTFSEPSFAVASTTITGWLVPDSTHFANSIMVIIMPLGGVGAFVWLAKFLGRTGDEIVYFVLFGGMLGSWGADLANGQSGGTAALIPFGIGVVFAILMFLWWWNN